MALLQLFQSESTAARRRIPVKLLDATDGVTEETGLTPTATVSKNGAAFGAAAGTVTEVGNGSYYYEATAGELDTLGFLEVRVADAAARTFYALCQVVASSPYVALVAAVADAVLEELVTDHETVAGSLANYLSIVKGLVNGNTRLDNVTYVGGRLTAARIRVFPTGADVAAGTNVLATFAVAATNSGDGPTDYQVAQQ